MRRALIALAVALLIYGSSVACFLAFEPAIGPVTAFWPAVLFQLLLERAGIPTTNRIVVWPTLLFWWAAVWLALRVGMPKHAERSPISGG